MYYQKFNIGLVFFLTTIFPIVITQDRCTTPYKRQGYCVWADDCPPIFAVINNRRRTRSDALFLRDSLCETAIINNKPELKVCCDIKGSLNHFSLAQPLCKLPNFPEYGAYKAEGEEKQPGTKVPKFTVLTYECQENHFPYPQDVTYCQDTLTWDKTITCNKEEPMSETEINKKDSFDPASLLPPSGECGVNIEDKILGGKQALIDEYPWMALIEHITKENKTIHSCIGSLINKNYVLTAAHCVHTSSHKFGIPKNIILGEYDLSTTIDCISDGGGAFDCNDPPVTIPIETIIVHEDFDPSKGHKNDLALIRLKTHVEYTGFISPICLPTDDKALGLKDYERDFTISGWQTVVLETTRSNVKLFENLPYVTRDTCQKEYTMNFSLSNNQLCAGSDQQSSCKGNSGSPLMDLSDSKAEIVGITTITPIPCSSKRPAIFTQVFPYRDWIISHLKP